MTGWLLPVLALVSLVPGDPTPDLAQVVFDDPPPGFEMLGDESRRVDVIDAALRGNPEQPQLLRGDLDAAGFEAGYVRSWADYEAGVTLLIQVYRFGERRGAQAYVDAVAAAVPDGRPAAPVAVPAAVVRRGRSATGSGQALLVAFARDRYAAVIAHHGRLGGQVDDQADAVARAQFALLPDVPPSAGNGGWPWWWAAGLAAITLAMGAGFAVRRRRSRPGP